MKACVIGGGTWGSAFALHLGSKNIQTNLWIMEEEVYEQTLRYKENKTFLPGAVFPTSVSFFNKIEDAVKGVDSVFIAVPSKFCRSVYEKMAPLLSAETILVSLTKGIEEGSLLRMSQVMQEVFSPHFSPRIAVLSGPSFAREVAESHPTAVVLASKDPSVSKTTQHYISNLSFRAYTSEDVIGLEIAGALKNVIAIASGISEGLQFGANSMAGLVTRGLAELTRLGTRLGAKPETFAGLAGVGDLVLTCTGRLSRNRYVGYELGKGRKLEEIVSGMKMIAEGITTTLSGWQLAQKNKTDMPICEQVYRILYEGKDPRSALQNLMSRKLREE
jgi:glycerol-3-phosphate dehydrogenase (NAD(P)+)